MKRLFILVLLISLSSFVFVGAQTVEQEASPDILYHDHQCEHSHGYIDLSELDITQEEFEAKSNLCPKCDGWLTHNKIGTSDWEISDTFVCPDNHRNCVVSEQVRYHYYQDICSSCGFSERYNTREYRYVHHR
ncbi:hypothetical protein [Alkaliphilus crotonatoxidans]